MEFECTISRLSDDAAEAAEDGDSRDTNSEVVGVLFKVYRIFPRIRAAELSAASQVVFIDMNSHEGDNKDDGGKMNASDNSESAKSTRRPARVATDTGTGDDGGRNCFRLCVPILVVINGDDTCYG